jgi:hypothetical protein
MDATARLDEVLATDAAKLWVVADEVGEFATLLN